jgi:hypothetical protein
LQSQKQKNLAITGWNKRKGAYRELSSAGSEHLPYKQRVGGSNPSAPTKMPPRNRGLFYFQDPGILLHLIFLDQLFKRLFIAFADRDVCSANLHFALVDRIYRLDGNNIGVMNTDEFISR